MDGKYRNLPESNVFNTVLDSLYRASTANNKKQGDFIEAAMDSLASSSFEYNFDEQRGIILMKKQIGLDSINVLMLMHHIASNKFPNIDTLECFQKSLIVFVHTPQSLIDDVSIFVEKHKALIPKNNYQHIIWHLRGRNTK